MPSGNQNPGGKQYLDLLGSVLASLKEQRKQIDLINVGLQPGLLQKRVELQLQLEKSQKRYVDALQKERELQKYGTGATGFLRRAFAGATGDRGAKGPGAALGRAVGGSAAAAAAALQMTLDAIGAIGKAAVNMAGMVDPAGQRRFNQATADVSATIGKALVPVLELVTKELRLFGDFLASILPSTDEVRQALSPLGEALDDFRSLLADIAPVIKDLIRGALVVLGTALRGLAYAVTFVIEALREIGLLAPSQGKGLKSSVGAAPGPARFTDPTEYVRQVQARAFSLGKKEDTPAVRTNNILNEVKATIDGIKGVIDDLKRTFYDPVKRFIQTIIDQINDIRRRLPAWLGGT